MADTPIAVPARLDHDNPWPGLASFTEADKDFFHGRDAEAVELFARVQREILTVLFGRSGLGKSSLLNAGLFPLLREQDYLPVYIRLDHSDSVSVKRQVRRSLGPMKYAGQNYRIAAALRVQVLSALREACAAHQIEAPTPNPDETLWSFFHRSDCEFWSARNRPVIPVLVFDQFEELFTIGQGDQGNQGDTRTRERCEVFITELGDLIENRMPAALKAQLDDTTGTAQGRRYDFRAQTVKLMVSFREDFLAEMEGLKHSIPSLMHNRFRLQAMTGVQAFDVIQQSGGHLVDGLMARRIIGLAGRGKPEPPPTVEELPELEIDPALLSVVCSELNIKRQKLNEPVIAAHLLEGAEKEILSGFYERSFEGLAPAVRVFVEDNLLTASGYRNSYARDDALAQQDVTAEALGALIERRLVREEERLGVRRLELTHDILTRVVQDSRDARKAREAEAAALAREREAAKKQRRNRILGGTLAAGLLAVLLGAWYVWDLRGQATLLLREALASRLIATADRIGKPNTDLALVLNAEALRVLPDYESRRSLLQQLQGALPLIGYLHGDKVAITYVAFSQNGKFLASISEDNTVTLWDPRTRERLAKFEGHKSSIRHLVFSPDSNILASASFDKTVMLWDTGTRTRLATLEGHKGAVNHVAFSSDGKTIASASFDSTVILWDTSTFARLETLAEHKGFVVYLAFSPNNKILASASYDKTVILWDTSTRSRLAKLEGHKEFIVSLAFSPDGKTLASAGGDKSVILWDAKAYALRALLPHQGHSPAFSPDGKIFATNAGGGVFFRDGMSYDRDGGPRLKIRTGLINHFAFSPDGAILATAGKDNKLELWDITSADWKSKAKLEGHKAEVNFPAFSPDSKTLASASADKTVILWDLTDSAHLNVLQKHDSAARHLSFGLDGKVIVSANNDFSTDREVLSPDGKTLASVGDGNTVIVSDAKARSRMATFRGIRVLSINLSIALTVIFWLLLATISQQYFETL